MVHKETSCTEKGHDIQGDLISQCHKNLMATDFLKMHITALRKILSGTPFLL
jgi:hypothetical protein